MDYNSNPFLIGFLIVVVINFMVIFLVPAKSKKTLKTYFRSGFYQYIFFTFVLYFHHAAVEKQFKQKFESELSMDLVSKEGPKLIQPDAIQGSFQAPQIDEDDFI